MPKAAIEQFIKTVNTTLVPLGDGCKGCVHLEEDEDIKWCTFFYNADVTDNFKCELCKAACAELEPTVSELGLATVEPAKEKVKKYMWNTQDHWEGETDGEQYGTRSGALLRGLQETKNGDIFVGERSAIDMDSIYRASVSAWDVIEYIDDALNEIVADIPYFDNVSGVEDTDLNNMLGETVKAWAKKRSNTPEYYVIENIKHFNRDGTVL